MTPRPRWLAAAGVARARRPLNALLRTRMASALVTPHDVDDYLAIVDPVWSVSRVHARVVALAPDRDGAASLWLRPNENWHGFRAGQFVQVTVRIDGVLTRRCFSISSAPEDGALLRLTVKAHPAGRASAWLVREARPGDVVALSPATGRFQLPDPLPDRLLFISGGSGITPLASMARHLAATGYAGDLAWLHYARREVILGDELDALSRRSGFRLAIQLTQPANAARDPASRLSPDQLDKLAPGWRDRETFACGPAPLLEAVTASWHRAGRARRLHVERFQSAQPAPDSAGEGESYRLVFAASGRETRGHAGASLLVQAERAGLAPEHGCRIGICHSCVYVKRSGVVRNELTGAVDAQRDEPIQLCVSTPRSDVALDL